MKLTKSQLKELIHEVIDPESLQPESGLTAKWKYDIIERDTKDAYNAVQVLGLHLERFVADMPEYATDKPLKRFKQATNQYLDLLETMASELGLKL